MNILKLMKFQLYRHKKQLIIWGSIIGGILFMYMILFPFIEELGMAKIESFGEEFLKMFGMDGFTDFTNFVLYYGVMLRMVSVAITVFSILFMGNLIFKEEREKTIELYANIPISRQTLWVSKLAVGLIGVFLVTLTGFITITIAGLINGGETYVFLDTLKVYLMYTMIPLLFGLLSFSLASISAKYNMPAVSTGILFLLYFIGYIGALLEDKGTFLTYISPFEQLNTNNVLSFNVGVFITLITYVILIVSSLTFGFLRYQKRDYVL